ncbi:hypothetical protein E2C01_054572 [Portunus trituberculatus]|uniref:Uncharacterized protein n=1 Tax=Portunus trituberculatus TaxID=210409 RepID=A0A5B7GT12_PORTR|nr:hypothetical protein [Portunus trituberculatus]
MLQVMQNFLSQAFGSAAPVLSTRGLIRTSPEAGLSTSSSWCIQKPVCLHDTGLPVLVRTAGSHRLHSHPDDVWLRDAAASGPGYWTTTWGGVTTNGS